jgi:3-hydroxyanthranilate 3,4-dioxygenase
MVTKPINLEGWIEEHKDVLKPPIGNKQIFKFSEDYIIMVVGGPNNRKDYHYNETEEFFYQIQGSITLGVYDEDELKEVRINEGDLFLLPGKIPHSPKRPENTIGLVIERVREKTQKDGFVWFCENCSNKLHEVYFELTDIETQLPKAMKGFYQSEDLRTCDKCGATMEPPK